MSMLPPPVVCRDGRGGTLYQPGTDPATVLSLHTLQGRRLRITANGLLDLSDLPADDYLLRVQQPGDEAHVLLVHLD